MVSTKDKTCKRNENFSLEYLLLVWMTSSIARAAEGTPHTPITPIRHLIVIVGENHSFDNLFGAYQPVGGQTVSNLLSEGNHQCGRNAGAPFQSRRNNGRRAITDKYSIAPSARSHSRRCRSRIPHSRSDANRMSRIHDFPPICRTDHSS